jgi:hypothetical protein
MPLQELYERGQLARTNFLYEKAVFMARMQVRKCAVDARAVFICSSLSAKQRCWQPA